MPTPAIVRMTHDPRFRTPSLDTKALWHELNRRFPEDRRVASFLARILWMMDDVSGLESLFGTDPHRFDDPLMREIWIRAALDWGDPLEAERRAREVIANGRGKRAIAFLLVEAIAARFEFELAAATARKVAERFKGSNTRLQFEALALAAERRARLFSAWRETHPESQAAQDYRVLLINLDRDTQRLERSRRLLEASRVPFERIQGVLGSARPDLASAHLTRNGSVKTKGTLGCFLSHVRAWEACVESGSDWTLVLEDDAALMMPLPPSFRFLELPDCDVCFVNRRNEPDFPDASEARILRLADAVSRKSRDWRAPGTDGYLVSRRGARRLLERVARDGLFGDVDWRLVFYGLGPDWPARFEPGSHAVRTLEAHARVARAEPPLDVRVFTPALIQQIGGASARLPMNEAEHAHLEAVAG